MDSPAVGGFCVQGLKYILSTSTLIFLTAGFAFAAEGSHHYAWDNFILRTINIILFLIVVWFLFAKRIKGMFKGRTEAIASEISSLESQKKEAQNRLADVERRIANLDQEKEEILRLYREQGESLKTEIISQAEKTAEMIKEQARNAIENEMSQAIQNLRNKVADEIITTAEDVLLNKLTPAEQEKLIDESLSRVVLN